MSDIMDRASAIAPASVANVAVGFDILGFSVPVLFDKVTATKIKDQKGMVIISAISGVVSDLPSDPKSNTAGYAVLKLLEEQEVNFSISLEIEKGIPLGSGLGGSAASAVAAVTAVNELLEHPLDKNKLLRYALLGESVASGSVHGDNVSASLFGGLVLYNRTQTDLFTDNFNGSAYQLPFPNSLFCVIIHPHIVIETREARNIINPQVSLQDYITQSMHLSSFIVGCYTSDMDLIESSLHDIIIEPQRKHLIPNFDELKNIAITSGAIGFAISGAGPSMFAFCRTKAECQNVIDNIVLNTNKFSYEFDLYSTKIDQIGSYIVQEGKI